jgi:3-dehydroquinate synthetase
MKVDKKARDATPEFTLIKSIGKYAVFEKGYVAKRFDIKELEQIIEEYRTL